MKNEFYTVTSSTYAADIQILRGKLESEGIPVFLRDENTINTDPLISDAIGGVKLKVRATDVIKAKHILNSINQFSLDDDGNAIHCPKCDSTEVHMYSTITDLKSFLAFVIGFISGTLPFSTRYKY